MPKIDIFRRIVVTICGSTILWLAPTSATAVSNTVVISQVYGGAGCGTAGCGTYQNDFIELFNRGTTAVSLNGWSIQYTAATGSAWQVTVLTNLTLQPGQYYLISESFGANGVNPLPTPDVSGTIAMSATAGKVALVNTTPALSGSCPSGASIVDFVGYGGTPNCSETSPAPAPSTTTADVRKSSGCTESDNNGTDFSASGPTPRNSSSPFGGCTPPSFSIDDVTVIEGNDGTVNATFTVTTSFADVSSYTVDYATADNTAHAPADYIAQSGTLTIPAGTTTQQITVVVNGGTVYNPDKTFFVNLSNAGGAISKSQGVGTIKRLRITAIARAENDICVTFPTVTGRMYRLEGQSALSAMNWTAVGTDASGIDAPLSMCELNAALSPPRFYRIELVSP